MGALVYHACMNITIEFPEHLGMLVQWIQTPFQASFYFDISSQPASHILTQLRNLYFLKQVITGNFFSKKCWLPLLRK